jgi:hypothetical protein
MIGQVRWSDAMSDNPVTGEVSNSKLAAVFNNESAARAAAQAVIAETNLQPMQVKVITPDEPHPGIKMEPEGGGILRTIIKAHLRLGLVGLVAGALLFVLLRWLDVPAVVQSPWAAGMVMTVFGGVAGLFLGGLISLRPDHDRYIHATRDAMAERRTTVVVHALSEEQLAQAKDVLSSRGAEITRTL